MVDRPIELVPLRPPVMRSREARIAPGLAGFGSDRAGHRAGGPGGPSGDQYGYVLPNHVPQLRNAARSYGLPFLPTYSAANQTLPASSVAAAL